MVLPEVFLKAVSVVRNFGHNLDGLVTVNVDKESHYRSTVNVLNRPSSEGIELIGHHEILLPLLHAAVACQLAARSRAERCRRRKRVHGEQACKPTDSPSARQPSDGDRGDRRCPPT